MPATKMFSARLAASAARERHPELAARLERPNPYICPSPFFENMFSLGWDYRAEVDLEAGHGVVHLVHNWKFGMPVPRDAALNAGEPMPVANFPAELRHKVERELDRESASMIAAE